MNLLPTLSSYALVFFVIAGLGLAAVVGLAADFLVRNHAQRLRMRMPVVTYYRTLALGH